MDDLGQQINQILSDPNSMQQIQSIMSSLGMGGQGNTAPAPTPAPAKQQGGFDPAALTSLLGALGGGGQQATAAAAPAVPATQQGNPLGALGALGGLGGLGGAGGLGGVSPEMIGTIAKLAPLLGQINQEDDSTRLLKALRPLLGEARRKKVDEAMKILQMMRLLPLLKESGVFSGLLSGLL